MDLDDLIDTIEMVQSFWTSLDDLKSVKELLAFDVERDELAVERDHVVILLVEQSAR